MVLLTKKVSPKSLPECLTLYSQSDALTRARDVAAFLQEAVTVSDMEQTERVRRGMFACFALLDDILAIASGDYAFPLAGDDTDPDLCKRKGVDDVR